jgi:hypothetical protein
MLSPVRVRPVGRSPERRGWVAGWGRDGSKGQAGEEDFGQGEGGFLYTKPEALGRGGLPAVPCRCVTALDPPTDPAVPVRGGGVR